MRLMTLVCMLGVLLMFIFQGREPNTWTWLVGDAAAGDQRSSSASLEKNEETTAVITGPTDRDPEESEAIQEEFQAVTDATLSIGPEEMPAYNRLLQWVRSQTLAEMRTRAKKDAIYTQFYQSPGKYRGQLFDLELNVRRIIKYEHNGQTLYEVWGWTAESRSWPYVGVVVDVPKGMPIGPDVYEKVTLVGYFFKMQGYHEAGAKPHDPPLQAPLFVGRFIWHPAEKPQAQHTDWTWSLYLLAGFVIFLIVRWGLFLKGSRRPALTPSTLPAHPGSNIVEDWLENADKDEPEDVFRDSDA